MLKNTQLQACGSHPNQGPPFHILLKKKDRLCLIKRHLSFQQQNQFIKFIWNHLNKIIFNHSEGGWEGQNKSESFCSKRMFTENCFRRHSPKKLEKKYFFK